MPQAKSLAIPSRKIAPMRIIQSLTRFGGRIIEGREHRDMVKILRKRQTFSDVSLLQGLTMRSRAAGKLSATVE